MGPIQVTDNKSRTLYKQKTMDINAKLSLHFPYVYIWKAGNPRKMMGRVFLN